MKQAKEHVTMSGNQEEELDKPHAPPATEREISVDPIPMEKVQPPPPPPPPPPAEVQQPQMPPKVKKTTSKHLHNLRRNTTKLFVLEENDPESTAAWEHRRIRMASSMGHGLKEDYLKTSKVDVTVKQESAAKEKPGGILLTPNKKRTKKSVLLLSLTALRSFTRPRTDMLSSRDRRRQGYQPEPPPEADKDIVTALKETVVAITNRGERRHFGIGIVGEFFERKVRGSVIKSVKQQIDNLDDSRPFFTYWVTFVQIVIMLAVVAVNGFAPVGIGVSIVTGNVHMPNLAIQTEYRMEVENLWIGPRQADLIHIGAKYSPCMREDANLKEAINHDRKDESQSACCIRKDGSGCVQMVKHKCDNVLSTWLKWSSSNPGPDDRLSGAVCGQDPRYCNNPSSSAPFEWPTEITRWPVCIDAVKVNNSMAHVESRHMHCEILGRPCCYGIQGECTITTKEHCNLLKGFFHNESALCAQVNCIKEICGMFPFADPAMPDQFYRLFTSLFIHGGLIHLSMSVAFQMWVMRDLEKLLGTFRMVVIYFGSGIAGNLASCTFLPYTVEVGPSGAHFGVAACLFVEVIQSYQMFKHPHWAIIKLCVPLGFLFLVGLMPWVDNWAHLFGFFFGFLLAFSLMPYVTFGHFDRRRKLITVFGCLGAAIVLFAVLVVIFYFAPLTDCHWCAYFNCIPLTLDFCDNMNVRLKKNSTYSKFI